MRCLHTDHMWDGVLAPCHVTSFQRTFTPTKGFAEGREADGKSNGMRQTHGIVAPSRVGDLWIYDASIHSALSVCSLVKTGVASQPSVLVQTVPEVKQNIAHHESETR